MNVFFYDGKCPFCAKTAAKLETLCISKEIQFISFRNLSLEKIKTIHPNLNEDILTANVQFIYQGVRYPGFFAIRKLCRFLKFYRFFFWVLYLPLIPIAGILFMNFLKTRRVHDIKK